MKADTGRGRTDTLAWVPLRVLVVEDSEGDTLLLLRELRRGGYEPVHERVDTPEAMQRALDERGPWDLIISDWRMPRFSATRALGTARAAGSEAPFIIVSGKVGEETAVEAVRAGAYDYVMKDNLTRLCATVERGLEEARVRREGELAGRSFKESEERFRTLVMNSSDIISVFDADGTRLYVSPSVERVLGYKPETMTGGNAFDLVHPDDAQRVREELVGRAQTPGTGRPFEFRSRHADGSWRTLEAIGANLLEDPSVGGILFNARDVTDRKRAEEERDRLFELSLDLLCVAGLDGHFKRVNPAFEAALGYSCEELLAKPFVEFVHPEDRAATMSEIERLRRSVPAAYFENRFLLKDGSEVWLAWKTVPVVEEDLIYATARDITERKQAEEALRRRDAILRTVAFAAERFLKATVSWEEGIDEVLERLGAAAEASRVYVFENYPGADGELWTTQRYERVGPGIPAQIDNPALKAFPYRAAGFDRWTETLGRGGLVYGHTRTFPEAERRELRGQGIESIMTVPVFVEGEWWGFIGFDECEREREWSGAEIEALKAVADTLGAAIQRDRAGRTLRESEERYRAVIEHATEGIFFCDPSTGDILESNAAFRNLLGYTAGELRDTKIYDLIAHDRQSIDANMQRILEEGSRFLGERKYRRKDGSLVDVEAAASVISYGGRRVVCDVVRDVTERKKVHRMLEQRVAALAGISASLTIDRPVENTLNALAARIVESTEAVACSVVLIAPETAMIRTAGSHGLPEGYTAAMQASWRAGIHGRMVRVFRSQRPSLAHDARRILLANPLYAPVHRFVREARWDTVYIVPLVARGAALGAINLYYLPGMEPTEDERAFLGAVADQTAIAVENARLFAAAQEKAALEERQHLSRELHDSVSQALYGIALGARTARALLDREDAPERVAEWMEYVLSLAGAGLAEMRALIFELRPESLEAEGLVAALEKQVVALEARHEIPVRANLSSEPDLPLKTKEALHNIVKHAHPSSVDLIMKHGTDGIILGVSDDGVGFDPEASFPGHLGLKSMRERAARVGGELRVESAPGKGTSIRVRIPPGT